MARQLLLASALVVAVLAASTSAFVPSSSVARKFAVSQEQKSRVNMGFMGDEEPKKLTRENEPDEYFTSKMDKMSDEEKLPIALAGLAFISLPFIAGLIALYAAK
mmetsp:Transcript_17042/g.23396  ORF Transcript_17042/g.23396 Transcript_17042/m.23396 type:complete len:105 (-) Transcript_17042:402-716(-)